MTLGKGKRMLLLFLFKPVELFETVCMYNFYNFSFSLMHITLNCKRKVQHMCLYKHTYVLQAMDFFMPG